MRAHTFQHHQTTYADPSIAAVAVKFPPNRYTQDEAIGALTDFAGPEFRRFALSSGVDFRHTALPLARYRELSGFTEANDAYIEVALDLAEQALLAALDEAKVKPSEVDIVFSTTVTGLAVPTLEARLAARVGLRQDVKRVPLFGLGCVAGAAGVARMHDYLRAFPDQVAALLAVELCSLTIQRKDNSVANLVATSLFGDGAAAVIAKGADRGWPARERHRSQGAGHPQPDLPRHRRGDGLEDRQRRLPDRACRSTSRPSPRNTWATTSADSSPTTD